ncbi:DUF397 domain-containing protein [Actinomadura gamaensis]|uniref:DUF397 domain-containing protein n=1 Tax=Actinomadura gamaensis TaxID=1763541 RepID=A0ABV9UC26_9ACTN
MEGCWMVVRSERGDALDWRKSSASGSGGDCVEVAVWRASVLVRDSHAPERGEMEMSHERWHGLLTCIRAGRCDVVPRTG